jgi:hypothetical protein
MRSAGEVTNLQRRESVICRDVPSGILSRTGSSLDASLPNMLVTLRSEMPLHDLL